MKSLPDQTRLVGVEDILHALSAQGVQAIPRVAAALEWDRVLSGLSYQPVDYSAAMIDYQRAYWSGHGGLATDASLVLLHDQQPCGVWPLSFVQAAEGRALVGSLGGAVLPPLFVAGLARKSIKSLTGACCAALQSLCEHSGQKTVECIEPFADRQGLSDWYDCWMSSGAGAEMGHDLFVDLSGSMADIKSAFRRSYKSLVSAGSRLWRSQVVTASDPLQWEEFRKLHLAVAGRATRSEESWGLQHEAVAAGAAFFVRLRDQDDRMVGAGLFHVTRDEGLYAVGAYDRALFDKPVGHVVQYHAIEEMKRRGLRWYKLGGRVYPRDRTAPTEKEVSISNFKQGFASHLFPVCRLRYEQAGK